MQRYKFLNAFGLKLIMVALMVLDHVQYFFPNEAPLWFTGAGRLVAPAFTFLMAQGLIHTRNRTRYVSRMVLFGAVMFGVNQLLAHLYQRKIPMNIFFALALSAAIICTIDKARETTVPKPYQIVILIVLVLLMPFVEGMFICPVMALIFYYLRDRPAIMYITYTAASFVFVFLFYEWIQLWMIAAIIPIALYNGRRGPDTAMAKYFFYLFYPLHIWILYLIKVLG